MGIALPDSLCIMNPYSDERGEKMNKPLKIKFYSDWGHGWAAIKLDVLSHLGILSKITGYSYYRGATAYLEEDCDFSLLVSALKEANIPYELVESKSHPARSPIRSYDSIALYKASHNRM